MPDCATVPRFSITSSRDMPMPLSEMVSVPAVASGVSLIFQSVLPSSLSALASASNRTLLMASDALRDEFAEEDLAVGVERVRDEVEKLLEFGLEFERLGMIDSVSRSFDFVGYSTSGKTHAENRLAVVSLPFDRPPCASAACLATARPRPIPSGLPVTNGSNSRAAISAAGRGRCRKPRLQSRPLECEEPLQSCGVGKSCHLHHPARPGGLDRVADHVSEQVRQLGRVAQDDRTARSAAPSEAACPRAEHCGFSRLTDLVDQLREVARLLRFRRRLAQVEELPQVRLDAGELPQCDAKRFRVGTAGSPRGTARPRASRPSRRCGAGGRGRRRTARARGAARCAGVRPETPRAGGPCR